MKKINKVSSYIQLEKQEVIKKKVFVNIGFNSVE